MATGFLRSNRGKLVTKWKTVGSPLRSSRWQHNNDDRSLTTGTLPPSGGKTALQSQIIESKDAIYHIFYVGTLVFVFLFRNDHIYIISYFLSLSPGLLRLCEEFSSAFCLPNMMSGCIVYCNFTPTIGNRKVGNSVASLVGVELNGWGVFNPQKQPTK